MLPAAHVQAAIEILDEILEAEYTADVVIGRWFRRHRFAGSKDRLAIRDHIYDALRNLRFYSAIGGGMRGRAIMIGSLLNKGSDLQSVFSGHRYAPSQLDPKEIGPFPEASIQERLDIPDWLWPIWQSDLADKAQHVAQKLTQRAPLFLRVNLIKSSVRQAIEVLDKDGIKAIAHNTVPTALSVVNNSRNIFKSFAYQEGLVELQDASSQMSICSLPCRLDGAILDFCAGGGGKSLALAAWFKSKVFAYDTAQPRMKELPSRAKRAGAEIICLSKENLYKQQYGLVFCDVPCSGSGTWRRDPWAKRMLTKETLEKLIKVQGKILRKSYELVKPGGCLAYATCSVLKMENICQIEAFTSSLKNLDCLESNQIMPSEYGDGFFYSYIKKSV